MPAGQSPLLRFLPLADAVALATALDYHSGFRVVAVGLILRLLVVVLLLALVVALLIAILALPSD